MKKMNTKKTVIVASIVLIAGIIATQAFAHMGGGSNRGSGYHMGGGYNMGNGYHMGNGYDMMSGNHMGYGNQMMGYNMGNTGHFRGSLSAQDQEKMQDQMNAFFTSTRQIREQRYEKQLELNKEVSKSEKDQAKIDVLQKELFDLSIQFEKERFDHMTKMQKLFSDKNNDAFMGGGYNGC